MAPVPTEHISRSIYRIITDFISILIVALPCIFLKLLIVPFQRGFFCDDESIMYPYHESTISTALVTAVGLLVPIFFMTVCEKFSTRQPKCEYVCVIGSKKKYVPPWIGRLYSTVGIFVFGAVVTKLLTDVAKYTVGRLRPHFLDVCKPDVSTYNCSQGYITKFTCTGTNKELIEDARLSFLSGHSSFAMYSMLYLAIYVHVAFPRRMCSLMKGVIEVASIIFGFYTCLTRISDYKHHWSDVLAGGVLGVIICLIVMGSYTDLLKKPENSQNFELPLYKVQDAQSISQTSSSSGCETAVTLDHHHDAQHNGTTY